MADFLGITRQGYAKYENGQSEADHETLQKLADFFETTIDYLLGRTDDPRASSQLKFDFDSNKLTQSPKSDYYLAQLRVNYARFLENNEKITFEEYKELYGEEKSNDSEFEDFIKEVRRWYKEAPKDKEEDLKRLRRIFEAYKND